MEIILSSQINKKKLLFFILLICSGLILITPAEILSQESYGLGFIGQREPISLRTGLDLSYKEDFVFNSDFLLGFDLAFLPEKDDYFGYVLRIIADGNNIDLLYRPRGGTGEFYIVYGEGKTEILVESEPENLFDRWNRIEFEFKPKSDNLIFHFNEQTISIDRIGVKAARKFKFLFGANTYDKFATTDLPPMNIRNIQIKENNKEKYFWPLNDTEGNTVHDIISHKEAFITNPLWLRPLHTEWSLEFAGPSWSLMADICLVILLALMVLL